MNKILDNELNNGNINRIDQWKQIENKDVRIWSTDEQDI